MKILLEIFLDTWLQLSVVSKMPLTEADVCWIHPVLWVTAMNVKLSVPFLTSDWVLSKLLLFSAHSSTVQAFSIQLCPSESVWAGKKA